MIAKTGDLESPAYLAWVRRQRCYFETPMVCAGGTEPHHYPTKGSLGHTNDIRVVPVCRIHHRLAHGEKVTCEFDGRTRMPLLGLFVEKGVEATWWRFTFEASPEERRQVFRELERWRAAQQDGPQAVPW